MEPMITAAPALQGALLHRRDSSSSNSSGALDTCGYLSGDYGMIRRIHMVLLATNEPLSYKPLL